MTERDLSKNPPVWSLLALVVMVAAMLIVYLTGHTEDAGLLLVVGAASIPGLVAALSAERAARDIRNGTVTEKARQGAVQAIEESEVITTTHLAEPDARP